MATLPGSWKALAVGVALAACHGAPPPQEAPMPLPSPPPDSQAQPKGAAPPGERVQTRPSGLQYIDERVGYGPSPASSTSTVTVNYAGWLPDGTKFDSSYDRGRPLTGRLDSFIVGWREGVGTMRVGG